MRTTQPEPATVRAAIYTRVSTVGQVDGSSLDTQLDDCRRDILRRGWTVAGEFVDAGVSGAKSSRPALDQMLELVAERGVDVVVVAKLDRLGRSARHLLEMVETLQMRHVRIVAVAEGIDSGTAAGVMQLGMVGVLAEFERTRIAERVLSGLRARVTAGGFVGSSPPFGYKAVPDAAGRGVVLAQDPEQAQTFRMIYQRLTVDRVPMDQVLRELNVSKRLSDTGKPWTRPALATWVRRKGFETAAGTWSWGGIEVAIPAILSAAEVADWRDWLDQTAAEQSARGPYLLSRRVTSACGALMQGRTVGKQSPVYACPNRVHRRLSDPQRCDCTNVNAELLDDAVWSQVEAMLTDPHAAAALVSDMAVGSGTADLNSSVKQARENLAELQAAVLAEYQAALDDGWDASMARQMVRSRQDEVKVAAAALKAAQSSESRTRKRTSGETRTAELAAVLVGRLGSLSTEDRQQVIASIGLKIAITGFETCSGCGGTGSLPLPAGSGRGWPDLCGRCRRMRLLPVVTLDVTLPAALVGLSIEIQKAG